MKSTEDLDVVLQSLGYDKENRVHLFGHSYGGSLAHEYYKRHPEKLQSLILANSANNMKAAGDAYDRLARSNPIAFWKQNVCKVKNPALDDAMKNLGNVWSGMDVVLDYVAVPPSEEIFKVNKDLYKEVRALIITCQDDFGYESSRGWKEILLDVGRSDSNNAGIDDNGDLVKEMYLDNCAHYPHLEDEVSFGNTIDKFLDKIEG